MGNPLEMERAVGAAVDLLEHGTPEIDSLAGTRNLLDEATLLRGERVVGGVVAPGDPIPASPLVEDFLSKGIPGEGPFNTLAGSALEDPVMQAADAKLPEALRALEIQDQSGSDALRLHFGLSGGEPLSISDTAQRLGMSTGTTEQKIGRAVEQLRIMLRPQG